MMTNQQIRDETKLKEALARAEKDGNSKMISWCKQQLNYFKAYRRVK
jgi:hypothetical protein